MARTRPVTPEEIEAVGKLRVAGATRGEIRDKLSLSEDVVDTCWAEYRRKHNLPKLPPGRRKQGVA